MDLTSVTPANGDPRSQANAMKKHQFQFHIALSMSDPSSPSNNERQMLVEKTFTVDLGIATTPTLAAGFTLDPGSSVMQRPTTDRRHVFDFLGLPRELRDMIYKYMTPAFLSHQDASLGQDSAVGLVFVNKQIFNEFYNMYCVNTPYRLVFHPCNAHCACHGRTYEQFDKHAATAEPPAHNDLKVHHNLTVTLARKHVAALRHFPNIEISWSIPGHANHNGVAHIDDIVGSIAPTITKVIDSRVKTVKLTLRWTFKVSELVLAKHPHRYLGRRMEWIKAFRKRELEPKVLHNEMSEVGARYELVTVLEFSRVR